uniref:Rap-GAP domain-containing protein n=1 Tax=Astyanax mexicanus TaxID=7994 RepID=A0A8B9GR81_ASTMX
MTSLKHSPSDHPVVGTVHASEDFYTRSLRLSNGGARGVRQENAYQAGGMLGVPKMGVRARVADWPPRRDGGTLRLGGSDGETMSSYTAGGGSSGHPKLGTLLSPEDSTMLHNIHRTLQSKLHPASSGSSTESSTHLLTVGDNRGSTQRSTRRMRQRSNSDMTLSELDGSGDSGEDWGSVGTKWSPLHREYGSTSSIDQHGIATSTGVSGDSFFEMLMSYQGEKQDQRSPAPERLAELLMASHKQDLLDSGEDVRDGPASIRLRDKQPKRRSKSETGGESIFRKLRSVRAEVDSPRVGANAEDGRLEDPKPLLKPWMCQKGFAHYDVQSTLFNLNEVIQNRQNSAALRKNTTSGASAASAFSASATSTLSSTHSLPYSSPGGSQEELSARDSPSFDAVDDEGNGLVLSCPCFRTETGGDIRHKFGLSLPADVGGGSSRVHGIDDPTVNSHCNNAGVAVVEGPKDAPSLLNDRDKQYIIEHVDLGAYYYRKFFYLREHWNYFGVDEALGPVAVSIRREKLEEHKEHGQQYNYRIIFRTSELTTLRGSILEDSVPSSAKHGTTRGLPLKEVLDYLLPELDISCLRLALNTPKVTEQLMKLDEQGLSFQVKVGIMYCRAGQSTEEEMYNNETAGPAFEEFLQLLGEKVRLKGFTKYRAQLDTKTDSTGTHSLYTAYKDYEIMFHVSTMLPYTPNNKQQLLRKRHIGNDIVTIVFQEPGAHPFTPKNIRSHFQHVFIIVRVHNPCSDNTCYSVAVSRSGDVPSFGPAIPKDVTLPKSTVFRDFLLTKLINAENAAHKSDKFGAMATRTRQEYLRDLAERHVTSTPVESSGKFPFKKKKERSRPYGGAELRSLGAITWAVHVEDQTAGAEREGLLAISNEFVLILDQEAKALVFNCSVRDVIGWSSGSPASMKIYYERGENVSLRSINNNTEDFSEVVKRLEVSESHQFHMCTALRPFPHPTSCSFTLSSVHSGSPLSSTQEEFAPSASSPTHPSLSPGPKSFYPRQGATSKYLIGWKKPGSTINSVDFGNSRKRHQSDGHLGGQPQLRATMRVNLSPQHAPRSNIEEDLKKLITLDSPPPTCSKPSFSSSTPFPRSLQRTFSDESIFSVQREPLSAAQSDGLFGHSTMPRSPTNRSAPLRQNSYTQGAKSLGDLTSTDGSVFEQEPRRPPLQEPPLIPLPDASTDSGLDWSDLVDAAKAFEGNNLISTSVYSGHTAQTTTGLENPVSELESMVKLLQDNLQKVREIK